MWKFDPNDYMKRVFTPAAEAFSREDGRLPDVFERYDLPLDISDDGDIETAVRTVTAYWNKQKNNPKYGKLVSRLMKEAGAGGREDLRVLTNPEARERQKGVVQDERRKQRELRFEDLKTSISGFATKGYITPREKAELIAQYLKSGLTEAEITSHIRVPERETAKKLPTDQGLEQVIRNQIRTNLATLKKRDLYEFLDLSPNARPDEIKRRHSELYSEWSLRQNDFNKSAAQALLGIVQTHLSGGMSKYEAARVYDILERLRGEVRLMAADKRISRTEFEHLLAFAVKLKLDKSLATEYIIELAEECGAATEWSAGEATIACAECFAAAPRSAERCSVCGAALWAECPKCKARVVISNAACGGKNCGFVVANLPKVKLLVSKAQLALEDGALSAALTHAREAERLWGRQDEVAAVLTRIEARRKAVDEIRRRIDDAIASRKILTARRALAELIRIAPAYTGSDNKTVEQIEGEIEAQLSRLEAALARGREYEKNHRSDDAVFAFLEALNIAADAEDARSGLSRHAPAPPSSVRALVHDDHVFVEWAASHAVGNLEYLVVRRKGRVPATPDDGELVARTTSLSCRDGQPSPGSLVFYSVFTERGMTASSAAASVSVLVAREVSNFKLEAGDGVVRGAWDFDESEGRVRVLCREGDAPDRQTGREVALAGTHGFTDTQVQNGRLYYYRIMVEYRDARGQAVFTPGVVRNVNPEQPPKPVEHMVVTFEEGVLNLVWTPPPHGKVSVYRSEREPEWRSGTQISLTGLGKLGARLHNKSDGQAVDASPPNSPAYYVPVTLAGDVAIVGAARRFVSLPDVSQLVAEDFGHYLQLRWQWPHDSRSALVAWRDDAFPQDAYDPRASKRKISLGEYERQGGFRVENPARAAYKFIVFAAVETGGETLYSAGVRQGARADLRTAPPVAVSYTLSRGTLRRSQFTLMLSAEKAIGSLPELVVIAKRGDLQPLRSDEGTVVASIGGASIAAGERVPFKFDLNGLQRPVYLRAFFREAASYQSFRLVDPPPEQLRVR